MKHSRQSAGPEPLDAVGVGIGPFNLSVAALLQPLAELDSVFYEQREEFSWHSGLLLPEGSVQVSFLKDPVTLADPTNPYSFLSYLFAKRRLYRFLIAGFPKIKRLEFNDYFRWICDSLPNLRFATPVEKIDHQNDALVVTAGGERRRTRNVVLATGLTPRVPACAGPHLGDTVFHSGEFLHQRVRPEGRCIAVVGGGQSAAELVYHLLTQESTLPDKLYWIARRRNFVPLDDSPFVEEVFTPSYVDFFYHLPQKTRARLLQDQRYSSDGVNHDLLQAIYRRLYELEFLNGAGRSFKLCIDTELQELAPGSRGWTLGVYDQLVERHYDVEADTVILATGFEWEIPPCLDPIVGRLELENGRYRLREDYSIVWDGPEELKLFAQNAGRHCRGVPDPNLSLMAWRGAKIVNAIAGRRVYDVEEASSVFDWPAPPEEPPEDASELDDEALLELAAAARDLEDGP